MNLEARKYEFIQKLFHVNEPLLEKLETIINKEESAPKRIGIEQYNIEIDKAIEDVEKGNFYTQEEARKIASKW